MAFIRRTRNGHRGAASRYAPATTPIQENDADPQAVGGHRVAKLPHEHDETAKGEIPAQPDTKLAQAHRDIENGIVDTDRRSAYGLSEGPPRQRHDGPDTLHLPRKKNES